MTTDEAVEYVTTMIDRAVLQTMDRMVLSIEKMPADEHTRMVAISVFLLGMAERLIHHEAKAFAEEDAEAYARRTTDSIEQIKVAILKRYAAGSA